MPEEATTEETSQETPVEETTAEAVPEAAPEQQETPDLAEALQQVQATQQEMLTRLNGGDQEEHDIHAILGAEYEPEDEHAEGEAPAVEGQQTEADQAREFLRELVREELEPVRNEWQVAQRWQGIDALAQQYPEMNDPKIGEAIRDQLEQNGLFPGDGSPPHPGHVALAYKALKADAVASTETPAEAGGEQGATLETGAGPSAPAEEMDPETKAYMDAITGGKGQNAFVR